MLVTSFQVGVLPCQVDLCHVRSHSRHAFAAHATDPDQQGVAWTEREIQSAFLKNHGFDWLIDQFGWHPMSAFLTISRLANFI